VKSCEYCHFFQLPTVHCHKIFRLPEALIYGPKRGRITQNLGLFGAKMRCSGRVRSPIDVKPGNQLSLERQLVARPGTAFDTKDKG
jgi:hypothetical protein